MIFSAYIDHQTLYRYISEFNFHNFIVETCNNHSLLIKKNKILKWKNKFCEFIILLENCTDPPKPTFFRIFSAYIDHQTIYRYISEFNFHNFIVDTCNNHSLLSKKNKILKWKNKFSEFIILLENCSYPPKPNVL